MPETMDGEYISDQQDQEEYYGYDDTHCEHGTFVGGWAGPDYLCWACEDGISAEEWRETIAAERLRSKRYAKVNRIFLERVRAYDGDGKTQARLDGVKRLSVWLMNRAHWK